MEEWKTIKLSDCCYSISDGDHMPPPKSMSGIPFITISNINNNQVCFDNCFYVPEGYYTKLAENRKPQKGDILYTVVGTFGIPVYVSSDTPFVFQRHIAILRPKESINGKFLYYTLLSPSFYRIADQLAIGAVQRTIGLKALRDVEIKVPSLELQNRIVDILSSIEEKIELNNRINHNLEEQAQALYKSWFVDFEPFKDGNFVESELGMIPEGWSIYALEDLMEIRRGSSPRPIQSFLSNSGLRWLKISDATNATSPFVFSIQEHIRQEGLKNTVLRKEGTLVLSNSATPGLPKFLGVDTCIHDGWLYFENSRLSNEFMYLLFNHFRQELISQANGSVFMNLKTDILKKMKIAIPSQSTMNAFDNVAKSVFRSIKSRCQEIDILISERDSLLPRLMSGELTC